MASATGASRSRGRSAGTSSTTPIRSPPATGCCSWATTTRWRRSSPAGARRTAPAQPPAARPSPALRLTARRKSVEIGRRTRLVARLSGVARESGRRIALEVDKWPLDGRFVRARRGTTGRGGATRFAYAPRRNARLRARLLGAPTLVSEPVTIYADFARRVRKLDAGGRHPRLR